MLIITVIYINKQSSNNSLQCKQKFEFATTTMHGARFTSKKYMRHSIYSNNCIWFYVQNINNVNNSTSRPKMLVVFVLLKQR